MSRQLMDTKSFYALFTLAGTVVGVGIFALPYATWQVGLPLMLLYFLVLGGLVAVLHLAFAQVVALTPGQHRLPGYAKMHLGDRGEVAALLVNGLGIAGALLAYLIVGGNFLYLLLAPVVQLGQLGGVLLFFAAGSLLVYFGIKPIARIEFIALLLLLAVMVLILYQAAPLWRLYKLFNFEAGSIFLPFGIVLFSLWGLALIPEIAEMVGQPKALRRVILASAGLVVLLYLFFTVTITGITGQLTSKDAFSALPYFLPDSFLGLAFLFGFLTCFTSFITLGLTLKKVLSYDFKIPQKTAWLAVLFIPLGLYFLGLQDFLAVIGIVGGLFLAIEGILVLAMYRKAKATQVVAPAAEIISLSPFTAGLILLALFAAIISEAITLFAYF